MARKSIEQLLSDLGEGTEAKRYSPTETATIIKRVLEERWPEVKWSVRTSFFSGGNAVDIRWKGGPEQREIWLWGQQFTAGSFDGMIDLYTYDSTPNEFKGRKVIWGAKYVGAHRDAA